MHVEYVVLGLNQQVVSMGGTIRWYQSGLGLRDLMLPAPGYGCMYILTGDHLCVTAKEAGGSFQTQYPGQRQAELVWVVGRQMIFSWSE